jgi:hypothetical protein
VQEQQFQAAIKQLRFCIFSFFGFIIYLNLIFPG